jgi:FtsH-binding integral membrane protein
MGLHLFCPLLVYSRVGKQTEAKHAMGNPAISINSERADSRRVTMTAPAPNKFLQRYFYFGMSLLLAAIVVTGFQRTVNQNLFHPAVPRPLVLWFHGAAFSAWIVFFIAQSTLVRVRKVSWHRFIGWFGAGLAAAMVVLGFRTAIVMDRFDTVTLHQTGGDAFLSVPFYDMIAFGILVGLAILWRKRPEFHRRLIFIATCGLMDAPLGRFDFLFNNNLFFPCIDLLILLGVARDLFVEKRVHKVYVYALPLLIVGQSLSVYMWRHNPAWWQGITRVIMG